MSKDRPIIDRIILNRMIAIITSFILGVLKIIASFTDKKDIDITPTPQPPKTPKFPWLKKQVDKLKVTK
jgi:hypothetical protein